MLLVFSFLRLILKRIWYRRAILFPALLSVLATVTVASSVPLFSKAATEIGLQHTLQSARPALNRGMEIRLDGPALDEPTYMQATKAVTGQIQYYLGSDLANAAPLRRGFTSKLAGYHSGQPHQLGGSTLGASIEAWFLSGMDAAHITLAQGRFPSSSVSISQTDQGTAYDVEALISPEWAKQFHLQLDDVLELTSQVEHPSAFLRVHFVGFFSPKSQQDPVWFDDLDPFTPPLGLDVLPPAPIWLNETAFLSVFPHLGLVQPVEYIWFYYLNLERISTANAAGVRNQLVALKSRLESFKDPLISYSAFSGLDNLLQTFLNKLFFVTITVTIALLPGLVLLFIYLWLVANALAERSREEAALMEVRGASVWQVLSIVAVEALLLCSAALLVAPGFASQVTGLLIKQSFFGDPGGLSVTSLATPTLLTYLYAGIGCIVCFIAFVLPTITTSRTSFFLLKQQAARSRPKPIFLRLAPGIFLTSLGIVGLVQIVQRQTFFTQDLEGHFIIDWVAVASPTLLFLGAIGLSILFLPPLLILLDRVVQHLPGIPANLASRQMARRSTPYSRLILVLSLTVALGVFASLFSATMSNNYADRAAYMSGADLRLVEGQKGPSDLERRAAPLADHLALLPGVTDGMNALRVEQSNYSSRILQPADMTMLAIDSARFQRLAYWRSDFANEPVSTLMQALQGKISQPEALPAIVDDHLLLATGKQIGDQLLISLDSATSVNFVIVGSFHYFPTLDTSQYTIVCDLTRLLNQLNQSQPNAAAPNEVWLKLASDAPQYTAAQVENRLIHNPQGRQVIVTIQQAYDRTALSQTLRNDPLHSAISGAFFLDFIVAALLSVVGFAVLFYTMTHRRALEFGILRAFGLSLPQQAGALSLEQLTVLFLALILGLGAGIVLANIILPALSLDDTGKALLPPLVLYLNTQAAFQLIIFLLADTLVTLAVTTITFRQLKLQELVKFGVE